MPGIGVDAAVALGAAVFDTVCVCLFTLVGDGAFVGAGVMNGVEADCGVPCGLLNALTMLAAILFTTSGDTVIGAEVGTGEGGGAGEEDFTGARV